MNKLEIAIRDALPRAQQRYSEMTGWWLAHGPESFLQHEIARNILRTRKAMVFIEVSPRKIAAEFPTKGRGRTYEAQKRFDLIVWQKSSYRVRAVIEIKRAWNKKPVLKDAKKMRSYMLHKNAAKTGYVLVYSDTHSARNRSRASDRREHLTKRFEAWGDRLKKTGWKYIDSDAFSPHRKYAQDANGKKIWSWGYVLFRLDQSKIRARGR